MASRMRMKPTSKCPTSTQFLFAPADAAQLGSNYQTILPTSPGLGISPNPILAGTPLYLNGIGICNTHGLPAGCVKGGWLNIGQRLCV